MKIPATYFAALVVSLVSLTLQAQVGPAIPDITVAQGSGGLPIVSGHWTELGVVDAYQASVTSTVIVKNLGQAALNCTYQVLGGNAAQFELGLTQSVTAPAPPPPPGGRRTVVGMTTLPIKFTAPAPRLPGGVVEATLRISSNDPDQPVYDITLRGRIIAPPVAIEHPLGQALVVPTTVSFGEAQVGSTKDVTLTVRNISPTGLTGISHSLSQVDATGKTYQIIKKLPTFLAPGATGQLVLRYTPQDIKEELGTLSLIVNSVRRQYTVNLSGVGLGSKVSFESPVHDLFQGHTQVIVRVARSPVGAPASVMLTTEASPAATRLPYEAALPGQDYMARLKGASSVIYFAAEEAFKDVAVTLLAPDSATEKNQQFTLRLSQPGLATLIDLQRQTSVVQITSQTIKRLSLTVPQGRGTVALKAVPAAGATGLFPAAVDAYPKTALVRPGTQVTLTARPAANQIFDSWSLPSGLQVTSQLGETLSFLVPGAETGIDISLAARFTPTPFAVPAGQTTGVHALLKQDIEGGVAPWERQGYLTGTLTAAGTFSGKVSMAGLTTPVVATFYGSGPALFTIAGQKQASLDLPGDAGLALRLEAGDDPDRPFRATVFDFAGPVDLFTSHARRAVYSAARKVPAGLLNSAAKGYYTLLSTQSPWQPDTFPTELLPPFPRSHGFASVTLTPAGQITLTGVLADATSVTMSTALLAGDIAPVFIPMPAPGGSDLTSLVTGELAFTPEDEDEDEDAAVHGGLVWYRAAIENPGPKVVPVYPDGWPDGLLMSLAGGSYDATLNVQTALELDPVVAGLGNAKLTFTGTALSGQLQEITNFSVDKNFIAKIPAYDPSFTFTFAPATGLFSGTFTPAWADGPLLPARPAFRGIILQNQARGAGFYLSENYGSNDQESSPVILSK